jgi:putative flippase GtrA
LRAFLISGSINTLVTFLLYEKLLAFLNYRLAYTISFVVGIIFAFFFNASFVFKVRVIWKKLPIYSIMYLGQYLIGLFLLDRFIEYFELSHSLALFTVICITTPLAFFFNKVFFEN